MSCRSRISLFVLLASALAWPAVAAAQDDGTFQSRPHEFVGSLSCASVSCHAAPESRDGAERAVGQEYLHWLSDPHAAASRRMLEPAFQEVLRRASRSPDGAADPRVRAQCAKCHDPLSHEESKALTRGTRDAGRLSQNERGQAYERGIGCESCHGGARQWLTTHYERSISREQLRQQGLIDTKNVLVRARQCAACHVGSAENDVNHDFLAAGHPPLRFEMASYQALLSPKHWNDGPRRLTEPDYEAQLWAAGRIASAEAALALLEGRAKRAVAMASRPPLRGDARRQPTEADHRNATEGVPYRAPWPEFAEWNCFGCHQALRSKAEKRAGIPSWQSWNLEFTPIAQSEAIGTLRTAMQQSLIPEPAEITRLAMEARKQLQNQARLSGTGAVLTSAGKPLGARGLLETLAANQQPPTWDRCCLELAALVAAERTLRDHDPAFTGRIRRVAAALRFPDPRSEWPAVFPQVEQPASATMSLDEVSRELGSLRAELVERLRGTEY